MQADIYLRKKEFSRELNFHSLQTEAANEAALLLDKEGSD